MARPRTSKEHKRQLAREAQRRRRATNPLTPEEKTKKAAADKARQQTPEYKAWAAAKYRAKREAAAAHPCPDVCDVCGLKPKHTGKNATLHWDHCHATMAFRGWLCIGCNAALGYANDDPALLRKLADYLERAASNPAIIIRPPRPGPLFG